MDSMRDDLARDIAAIARIRAIPVLLDIACRSTGAGFAAVARVTETSWIAAALRDDIGFGLRPGEELPAERALCREVRRTLKPIVIEDLAADQRFGQADPAGLGYQSYVSVPILRADGSFFGTFCAFDKVPRPLASPETVTMFEAFAELIGFHLSAMDQAALTEANLSQERKTSALREQFIAVLGHDLRNPLTAILGGMEMLRKNPLNERARQWAEMVAASAARMAELIDVVVDFSRIRLGGGLTIECARCNSLEPALRQLLAMAQSSKPGRQINARFAVAAPVHCDLRRVTQLASSLLDNATTYGDPGRPVHLAAHTADGWFELSVANAGEPLTEALLERIFEPFSRGTGQPNREGLGLGLYISRQIALAHGGTLKAVSTARETRFTFRMPLNGPEN